MNVINKENYKVPVFSWCPVCKEDLCSNDSFLSDIDEVRYRCSNCGTYSYWNFDIAPAPILKK